MDIVFFLISNFPNLPSNCYIEYMNDSKSGCGITRNSKKFRAIIMQSINKRMQKHNCNGLDDTKTLLCTPRATQGAYRIFLWLVYRQDIQTNFFLGFIHCFVIETEVFKVSEKRLMYQIIVATVSVRA